MRLTVSGNSGARAEQAMSSLQLSIAAIAIVGLLLIVAWLDYATGTAPIQHLYYLPIILAAFVFDYWGGLTCAMAAILSYHLDNEHLRTLNYGESAHLQITIFLSVGAIAAKSLQRLLDHLDRYRSA